MRKNPEYDMWRFLRRWIRDGIGLLIVVPVLYMVQAIIFSMILSLLNQSPFAVYSNSSTDNLPFLFVYGLVLPAITFGCVGYVIGRRQLQCFRDDLMWEIDGWRRASAIGGALGGLAVLGWLTFSPWLAPEPLYDRELRWGIGALVPVFFTTQAICQWWVLRSATRWASLWILGNLSAGLVFVLIAFPLSHTVYYHPFMVIAYIVMAIVAQRFVLGVVLLHLLGQQAYAPEPVPAEQISVWDQAI